MADVRNEKRSRSFWEGLIAEFEAGPPVTHREFCLARQVRLSRFRHWLYRVRREQRDNLVHAEGVRFIELVEAPTPTPSPTPSEPIRVCVGGLVIETQSLPSPEWIAEVTRRLWTPC